MDRIEQSIEALREATGGPCTCGSKYHIRLPWGLVDEGDDNGLGVPLAEWLLDHYGRQRVLLDGFPWLDVHLVRTDCPGHAAALATLAEHGWDGIAKMLDLHALREAGGDQAVGDSDDQAEHGDDEHDAEDGAGHL